MAGAVGVVGLAGVGAATPVVGGSTAGELGSAVACPNIFDMRLVRIPIMAKYTPRQFKKPAHCSTSSSYSIGRWTKGRAEPGLPLISRGGTLLS